MYSYHRGREAAKKLREEKSPTALRFLESTAGLFGADKNVYNGLFLASSRLYFDARLFLSFIPLILRMRAGVA